MTRPSPFACVVLPFPPSTNGLFANPRAGKTKDGKGRKRPKSLAYRTWWREAEFAWIQQPHETRNARFDVPVMMTISLGRPDIRTRDVANYEKAISDFLVSMGLLADDSLVHDLRIRWDDEVTGARIEIEPLAARAAA